MLKQIAVADLLPGMLVTQVLEQSGPVKIRKVGMIRSPDMIKGLQEMGVSLVEVDLDQSLHVEQDEDGLSQKAGMQATSADEQNESSTQTQKLLASDKQIADVDRQLSQQFHRSLFLPAVDQMPSKWTLYGKPYSLLVVVVIAGLGLGWGLSYGAFNIFTSEPVVYLPEENRAVTRSEAIELESTDNEANIASNSAPSQGLASQPTDVNEESTTQTSANTNKLSSGSLETEPDESEQAQNDKPNSVQPSSAQIREPVAQTPREPSTSVSEVAGIQLEEGQQVLGYQSGTEDSPNEGQVSISPTQAQPPIEQTSRPNPQEDVINPELYRRIQEAAQAVERQGSEPEESLVNVTDLNDLPRIDQLPPAVLTELPAMSFSAHMYASNSQDRWVRVNSRRLGEGDYIDNGLVLKTIESEKVVLSFRGQDFTMNALSDW